MFSSFLLFVIVLASVHSFTFVAATSEPFITASSSHKPDITASSSHKLDITGSSSYKPNITGSSSHKLDVTGSSSYKPNITGSSYKPNITASSSHKPNITGSSSRKPNITASSSHKPNITAFPSHSDIDSFADGSKTDPILSTQSFPYSAIPEYVNPWKSVRGPQSGYNICNSSTLGPNSLCQTSHVNDLGDFCLFGSAEKNRTVAQEEAAVVVYCTQNTHGSRVFEAGTITGAQFTKTKRYVQVVGFAKNGGLGLAESDKGGELDPHGADGRGNPLGGIVFTTSTPGAKNGTKQILTRNGPVPEQILSWSQFIGNNLFCIKLCFPDKDITKRDVTNQPNYCQNIYDEIGCQYNMPNNAQNNSFTSCLGELQDPPGTYVIGNVTHTYANPTKPTVPPRVPASSSCQTFQSTDLYGPSSATATASGITGSSSPRSSTTGSTEVTDTVSSSPSSSGSGTQSDSAIGFKFPPAFYAVGLALMAGVALVL